MMRNFHKRTWMLSKPSFPDVPITGKSSRKAKNAQGLLKSCINRISLMELLLAFKRLGEAFPSVTKTTWVVQDALSALLGKCQIVREGSIATLSSTEIGYNKRKTPRSSNSVCSARLTLGQTPGESPSNRGDCFGQFCTYCGFQIIFYSSSAQWDLPATEGQDYSCL